MKTRFIWAAALLLAILATTGVSQAYRTRKPRVEVYVQEQANGHWQMFVFNAPKCPHAVHAMTPADPTQPVEIACN